MTHKEAATIFRILAGIFKSHADEDRQAAAKDHEAEKFWLLSASVWEAATSKTLEVADIVQAKGKFL